MLLTTNKILTVHNIVYKIILNFQFHILAWNLISENREFGGYSVPIFDLSTYTPCMLNFKKNIEKLMNNIYALIQLERPLTSSALTFIPD